MKFIALTLAAVTALSFSSCYCQSQPAPKLHPMPKNLDQEVDQPGTPGQPDQPVKVYNEKKGK